MTRRYMNERWCVRCSRNKPTPYLEKHWRKLIPPSVKDPEKVGIIDIGCGNGRNTEFFHKQGYHNTVAFDMVRDYGYKLILGEESFPVLNNSVTVILANYVFMFLDKTERKTVIKDLKRIAAPGCTIMVELYPAKDSFTPDIKKCEQLQKEIFKALGWEKILYSKHRFIAKNHAKRTSV